MGCCCPKDEVNIDDKLTEKISVLSFNKLDKKMKNCEIHLKMGEIMKEKSQCIILASDSFNKNTNSFNVTDDDLAELEKTLLEKNFNDCIFSEVEFKNNGFIKGVVHVVIPLWKGGVKNEQNKIFHNLRAGLKLAANKDYDSLSISDICSNKFGIPKQISAEIMCNAINEMLLEPSNLKNIYVCLKDEKTIRLYQKEFQKIQSQKSLRESFNSSQHYNDNIPEHQDLKHQLIKDDKQQSMSSLPSNEDTHHSNENLEEIQ